MPMKLLKERLKLLFRFCWKKLTAKDESFMLILDDRYKTPLAASDNIMQELEKMGKTCTLKSHQVMEIDGKDYFIELGRMSSRIPTQYVSLKQMDKTIY